MDTTHTRRWLLGALGGTGLGAMLGRANSADAATGDPLILGQDNSADAETDLYGDFNVHGDGFFNRDHATGQEAVLTVYNGDQGGIFTQGDNAYGIRAIGFPAAQIEGQLAGQFAGTMTIPAGAAKANHTMPYQSNVNQFGVTMVVASLQQHRAGVHVEAVVQVANPNGLTFTVFLNKAVTAATRVGFVVVN